MNSKKFEHKFSESRVSIKGKTAKLMEGARNKTNWHRMVGPNEPSFK